MYVISAFTSKYQKFAEELEQSIKKQGIDKYKIYYYDDRKDWAKNTQIKPEILLKAINEYNEPVLWVDADAEIYGDLNYFINLPDYIDIGVYYLNTKHKPNEMLSGTLYFGNTATSKQILTHWQNICNANKKWDQINLQKIGSGRSSRPGRFQKRRHPRRPGGRFRASPGLQREHLRFEPGAHSGYLSCPHGNA